MEIIEPAPKPLFDRIGGRSAIKNLLSDFYKDVQQHPEIAEIFTSRIEDWSAHLDNIADFWSGVTGGPRLYRGGMPWKHVPLKLEEKHFEAWLGLWAKNCHAHILPAEANELITIAQTIGQRLRQIIDQHG